MLLWSGRSSVSVPDTSGTAPKPAASAPAGPSPGHVHGPRCLAEARGSLQGALEALAAVAEEGQRLQVLVTEWCDGGDLHAHLLRLQQHTRRHASASRRPDSLGYLPSPQQLASAAGHGPGPGPGPASAARSQWEALLPSEGAAAGSGQTSHGTRPPSRARDVSTRSLVQLLTRGKQETVAAIAAALDVARGVAALHAAGLAHGRLEPRTVLCASTPHAKAEAGAAAGGVAGALAASVGMAGVATAFTMTSASSGLGPGRGSLDVAPVARLQPPPADEQPLSVGAVIIKQRSLTDPQQELPLPVELLNKGPGPLSSGAGPSSAAPHRSSGIMGWLRSPLGGASGGVSSPGLGSASPLVSYVRSSIGAEVQAAGHQCTGTAQTTPHAPAPVTAPIPFVASAPVDRMRPPSSAAISSGAALGSGAAAAAASAPMSTCTGAHPATAAGGVARAEGSLAPSVVSPFIATSYNARTDAALPYQMPYTFKLRLPSVPSTDRARAAVRGALEDGGPRNAANAGGADLSKNTVTWGALAYAAPETFAGMASGLPDGVGGCGHPEEGAGRPAPSGAFAADVYSLGALLWQLVSGGRPPHYERHPAQILMGLLSGDLDLALEWPEDVDPELAELGRACMRREPDSRPSAQMVAAVLESVLERVRQMA
ncbi:hypothetical protein HYH03_017719 [Edaphochlamys debaryana]|uniref:Serine-threonine/tyrosine-protein kinase catalytic domain-containing protein n=1 Tax=Edaphochlamys debaryana TaxID=47281 RepID=A0A835XHY1_9CHLO|nr:hypothetical protein HYH03_017719 [Edaphochlamys debaryana]|eukprot:KAG2483412.1 hypothetical protein HYH03_017719 [Edaphochlamys debaryana]